MILAIDMGNSNIVVGGLDDNKTYFEERITTDDRKTSLEYAILLKNILEIHKVKKNDIEGSIMASVVPPLNAPISSAVKKITGKKPFLVGSGMKTGLNIKMDNPKTPSFPIQPSFRGSASMFRNVRLERTPSNV